MEKLYLLTLLFYRVGMSSLDRRDFVLSYCILFCSVWLSCLGDLLFAEEETELGVGLGKRKA